MKDEEWYLTFEQVSNFSVKGIRSKLATYFNSTLPSRVDLSRPPILWTTVHGVARSQTQLSMKAEPERATVSIPSTISSGSPSLINSNFKIIIDLATFLYHSTITLFMVIVLF